MKKLRSTDAQVLVILKQGENDVPVTDICREHGISSATLYAFLESLCIKLRKGFMAFTGDGCVEMGNNPIENRIRPVALRRKNALFKGQDESARIWSIIALVISEPAPSPVRGAANTGLNGVKPLAWFTSILEGIVAGRPASRIGDLLTWNPTCDG